MPRALQVSIGVVVARERINDPWQEYAWRPVSVFLHAPDNPGWRELHRSAEVVHYHAATLMLELHAKETPGYVVNLESQTPAVYVVLRHDALGGGEPPVDVHMITASPYDAQAYGGIESELIERVAMPEQLIELLRAFVAEHHVEEPFVKRQRQRHDTGGEHRFGQQPIFEQRLSGAGPPARIRLHGGEGDADV